MLHVGCSDGWYLLRDWVQKMDVCIWMVQYSSSAIFRVEVMSPAKLSGIEDE
jgi:hypothetical protein